MSIHPIEPCVNVTYLEENTPSGVEPTSPHLNPTLISTARQAMEQAGHSAGKDIIVLVGNTGSGKSTAINGLLGCAIEWDSIHRVMRVSGKEIAAIGHERGTSKTLYTNVYTDYPIAGTSSVFADCGGFLDTRKEGQNSEIYCEVPVVLSLKHTLENANNVKLVICFDSNLLLSDNSIYFTDLLEKVLTVLLKDYKSVPKATMLMLTKPPVDSSYTRKNAINDISLLRNSIQDGDSRKELLDYVLREKGKYIAVYNPLVTKTKDYVLRLFQEMEGIQEPKGFFSLSYGPETRLKINEIMVNIALRGVNLYKDFFSNLEKIQAEEENLSNLENNKENTVEKLENKKKELKTNNETLFSEIEKQKKLLDQYSIKESEINSKIKSNESSLYQIKEKDEDVVVYQYHKCDKKIVRYKLEEEDKNIINYVNLANKNKKLIGQINEESSKSESPNEVKIKLFIQRKNHPETIKEKEKINKELKNQMDLLLKNEDNKKKSQKRIIEVRKLNQEFKNEEKMRDIESIKNELDFLKDYLTLSGDDELKRNPIVIDFFRLNQQFKEWMKKSDKISKSA